MKNQKERIIQYINDFGSITTKDAFNDLGIARLSSRIFELKEDGYAFEETWETGKNRYGEAVCFKRFSFRKEQANG